MQTGIEKNEKARLRGVWKLRCVHLLNEDRIIGWKSSLAWSASFCLRSNTESSELLKGRNLTPVPGPV